MTANTVDWLLAGAILLMLGGAWVLPGLQPRCIEATYAGLWGVVIGMLMRSLLDRPAG